MEQTLQDLTLRAPVSPAACATEFTVNNRELLKELAELQKVVQRRATVPILVNVLVQATGSVLVLTATDLDVSLRTTCHARIKKEGTCTIPAHKLTEYVRLLEDGDVTIRLLENHWVQIRSGRSHTKMVGMAPDSFPQLPLFPKDSSLRIESHALRCLIDRTIFAVSTEESRYTLGGALLLLNPEGVTMVATDGHRMAHAEYLKPQATKQEARVLVPKKALLELDALLSSFSAEHIVFAQDDSTLYFGIGSRLLTCRQIMGRFPNYESILPQGNANKVVVSRKDLFTAIQRVAQFSDAKSNCVRVKVAKNEIRVSSSNTETGESEDALQTAYTGPPKTIAFNSQYLLDFLRVVDCESVRLEFKDGESASELKPEDTVSAEGTYRYLVMPLRG